MSATKPTVIVARKSSSGGDPPPAVSRLQGLGYLVAKDLAATVVSCRAYDVVVVDCDAWGIDEHTAFVQSLIDDGQSVLTSGNDTSSAATCLGALKSRITSKYAVNKTAAAVRQAEHPIWQGVLTMPDDADSGVHIYGLGSGPQLLGSDADGQHAGQYEFTGFTEATPQPLAALGLAVGDTVFFSAEVWNTTAGGNERVRVKFWDAANVLVSTVDGLLTSSTTPVVSFLTAVIPANAAKISARTINSGTGTPQVQLAWLSKPASLGYGVFANDGTTYSVIEALGKKGGRVLFVPRFGLVGADSDVFFQNAVNYLAQAYSSRPLGTAVAAAVQAQQSEFVHLIEVNFSGGSLYMNTGARDLYWAGKTWDAIGGLLSFDAVQEAGEERGRGVQFQLSGVDQTIVSALLTNNYRGRPVRVWRAYLDPVTGKVIDSDGRGVRIGATVSNFLIKNPVGLWPTGNFSVEFWGRLDSGLLKTQPNWAFSYAAPGSTANTMLFGVEANTSDWRLRAWVKDTAGALDTVAYPDDHLWHHLAMTWVSSSGLASIYLDGVLRFTATISSGAIAGGGSMVLGQDQDSIGGGFDATQAWKGELDSVRVYNKVITAAEISEHMKDVFVDTVGLVQSLRFDQSNLGLDDSGAGNHCTVWGIQIPSEGAISKAILLFEGLQIAPYEIEEDRDRDVGTVTIKMRAVGVLGVEKIRGIEANITSHQHVYPGDTFFQNVSTLANLHVLWGTPLPTPIGGGGGGGRPNYPK